eukprot:CAMPEP_0174855336 /NCGR_PEP_ID=MMETSP1114-20130205/33042_1 /TAXON_ID=312471 /ORGANISM="Neobodo designis, Strain CCAP 1951/1" /LENGTH=323 /DNA_ID=CAMNT_0016090073 /DNA_START=42 /DNA_END=1013 /DNA_ORIENTATION=+
MAAIVNAINDNVLPALTSAASNTYVLGALGLAATGFVVMKVNAARKRSAFMATVKAMPKGVVYLYAIPRLLKGTPHLGHSATKVEAFLRVHNIPYEFHFLMDGPSYSPTETIPFIALDGELIGESQFCIDALKKRFNIPQDEGLTPVQAAVHTSIRRIVDLSLYQHNSRTTFVDNPSVMKQMMVEKFAPAAGVPGFVIGFMFGKFRKATINRLNVSGLGWFDDERYQIEATRDVAALSAFVQDADARKHKYLFGNKATSADTLLYGFVSSVLAFPELPNNGRAVQAIRDDKALNAYVKRFEAEFYADLDTIAPAGPATQKFAK